MVSDCMYRSILSACVDTLKNFDLPAFGSHSRRKRHPTLHEGWGVAVCFSAVIQLFFLSQAVVSIY